MRNLSAGILKLRRLSFYLFLFPTIAIIFSLFLNNIIVTFYFVEADKLSNTFPITLDCNKQNNFCRDIYDPKNPSLNFSGIPTYDKPPKIYSLDNCQLFETESQFVINDELQKFSDFFLYENNYEKFQKLNFENDGLGNPKSSINNKKIQVKIFENDRINQSCIVNSSLYKYYKVFPQIFVFIRNIRLDKKYLPATAGSVNPFLYGETSISNIVKRYPINFLFKPLLYITSLLMLLYWTTYKKVLSKITNDKKFNKFLIFGVISSIFLFLHVLFLGTEIDSKIFHKIRRFIVIIFLFSELLAQYYLVRKLYSIKEILKKYTNTSILNLKIIFVSIVLIISTIIIIALIIYNFPSSVDNILEWNYFLILLFFYLLSSLMWKKNINL